MSTSNVALGPALVHELFGRAVDSNPQAPAVLGGGDSISYIELDAWSNSIAGALKDEGLGHEDLVVVRQRRGLAAVASLLGILKAGCAYCPIDPDQPAIRTALLLESIDVAAELSEGMGSEPAGVPMLDPNWFRQGAIGSGPDRPIRPENLAYVLFTSGSSGRPKPVMVPHEAIAYRLTSGQAVAPLAPNDRVLQLAPLMFDFSVWEMLAPLTVGACVVLAPYGAEADTNAIATAIKNGGASVVHLVPSVARLLLRHGDDLDLDGVRLLFSGGEVLHRELAEQLLDKLGGRLVNQYGPTETCIDSTVYEVNPPFRRRTIPIGLPLPGSDVHLLDEHSQPVDPGSIGEICIAGPGLGRGYWGAPAATAEVFVPDPHSVGGRLYRTGDLGRALPGGAIEFTGRRDTQLKLHGVRTEPQEIEQTLRDHPEVEEAFVVADISPQYGPSLVAYVEPGNLSEDVLTAIRSWTAERLPAVMVPRAVVPTDRLPRLPSGKIDRHRLPQTAETVRSRPSSRADSPVEEIVTAIWHAAFPYSDFGPDDNFFDLGGHSLLATALVAEVRDLLGVELRLSRFFEEPTIRGMTARVDALLAAESQQA